MLPVLLSLHQHVPCATLVCQKSLSKDAVLISQTAYQSPITITNGGTYSGNWQSLDPNVPAVSIQTTQPVTIENSNLQGRGHLIQAVQGGANLTVRNTYGYGLNPNVYGQPAGRFLQTNAAAKVVVEHCYMQSTSGIGLFSYQGDYSTSQSIRIRYNRAHNIDGRKSDGNGGFIDDFERVQFAQLEGIKHVPAMEIAWNEVINEPYNSRVEDNINICASSGTAASPLRIHNNYIKGGYPGNAAQDSYSGGGIMVADCETTTVEDSASFVKAYSNQVLNTTNYGIGIADGHDNQFYDNRIFSSGILPDGTHPAAQFVGAYVADINGAIPKGTFFNNFEYNNTIGWVRADGSRQDTWLPDCASGKCTNNIALPNPITVDTENGEYQIWLNKLASQKVTIGPQ